VNPKESRAAEPRRSGSASDEVFRPRQYRPNLVLDRGLIGSIAVAEIETGQPSGDKFRLFGESRRLLAVQD
jgi:hypothetical protein